MLLRGGRPKSVSGRELYGVFAISLDEGKTGSGCWAYSFPESARDLGTKLMPVGATEAQQSEVQQLDSRRWQSAVMFSSSVYRSLSKMSSGTGLQTVSQEKGIRIYGVIFRCQQGTLHPSDFCSTPTTKANRFSRISMDAASDRLPPVSAEGWQMIDWSEVEKVTIQQRKPPWARGTVGEVLGYGNHQSPLENMYYPLDY